ncbi:MAG: diguanylate cyclase, partial [Gemmatimonadetes bacterium]
MANAQPSEPQRPRVPARALWLSLAALMVPVTGALAFPEALGEYGALLWLLALVPAFLFAYYRGWKGVATALALGMAVLSITQVLAALWVLRVPDTLLGVVAFYVAIALGIGALAERLHRDRTEVEGLAYTDALTRLPNRRHARLFLENEFAAAQRGRLLSIVLFDLDNFKEYNDRYGHPAGDEALGIFGDILATTTRRMNLAARFGGEEFLAILAGSDAEGAMVFAERVRSALRSRKLGRGPLTVSAGVAAYHPSMRSPDELLAAADHALYRAKREGRNCVRLFGRALLEAAPPTPTVFDDPSQDEPAPDDYPRPPEELGKSRPPVTLLPHQITVFGSGRQVLLVEEEPQVRALMATYLNREGFAVVETDSVRAAVERLGTDFDVVITDDRFPDASGHDLVAAVKSRWPATQVIVLTGQRDAHAAAEALRAGADRYLFKPFGMPELRGQLVDVLARRDRLINRRTQERVLSNEERERAERAWGAVVEAAGRLVDAAELRDPFARGHGRRVAAFAPVLG